MFQFKPITDLPRLPPTLLILSASCLLAGLIVYLTPVNREWMLWLNHLTPGLDPFWSFMTQFGDGGAALLLLLVFTRFSRIGTALSLKVFLIGSLLSPAIKSWVASPRPLGVFEAGQINTIGSPPSSANSMPSGHSMTIFAAVAVLCLCFSLKGPRWPWAVLLALFACLVALSRIMVGAHWPADVLAGAGLGLLAAWLAAGWESLRPWQTYLQTRTAHGCLLLTEVILVGYLLSAATATSAERLAFDLIATVGMAGALSRLSFIRRQPWA
jgi:membrane-associated phospholipid phosphatase